jgi:hypothetical protein
VSLNAGRDDLFGGTLTMLGGSMSITPTPWISLSTSLTRNHVELPSGSFTANIGSLRAVWALSTKITTNALLQYNSLTEDLITNIRFNFIHRPGSDLYVVFTEGRSEIDGSRVTADRGVVVKFTYLVRI